MKFTYFSPTGRKMQFWYGRYTVIQLKKIFLQLPGNFSRLKLDFLLIEVESEKNNFGVGLEHCAVQALDSSKFWAQRFSRIDFYTLY